MVYCQEQITKLDLEIRAAINDIQRCKRMDVLRDLNKVVSNKFREVKNKLNDLEKLAMEQDKETSKINILKAVESNRKQVNSIQSMLREANLTCQLHMEMNTEKLLKDDDSMRRRAVVVNKENAVSTSSNVTQNLMTLAQMMSDQVKLTEQTMGNLVSSSQQIGETQEELKNASGHIYNSKKLLTKYGRRELTDKLLILLALIFFFCTVLYVIRKRLFG